MTNLSPSGYRLTDIAECNENNLTLVDRIDPPDECPDVCPAVYDPVCGADKSNRYREFSNACFMGIHNCENPLHSKNHLSIFASDSNYGRIRFIAYFRHFVHSL